MVDYIKKLQGTPLQDPPDPPARFESERSGWLAEICKEHERLGVWGEGRGKG